MKNRIGLIVLLVVCLGLGIALLTVRNQAKEQQKADGETILDYSNKLGTANVQIEEQKQVAANLYKDLDEQKKAIIELTNNYTQVASNLSQTTTDLAKTEASLKASQDEVAKRDAKISDLETQNQALDKKALDLNNAITGLTAQINDTQHKLAASEGDRAFLEGELKRLTAEKAELERQFNDLAVLRAQVAKLKEEMNIARRLEWIRQGLFAANEEKGAQKLMQGVNAQPPQARMPKPNYDLNVEVSADGSVKVIPPATNPAGTTNSATAK